MNNQSKLLSLESLRGIAALSVALFHFNIDGHLSNTFVSNAWLMVDFFFVLSGFVMALNYQGRIANFESLWHFQLKRFLRLYPLHLMVLCVFLAMEIAKYVVEANFGMTANEPAFKNNDMASFVANIFLLQNWMFSNLTWNYPSWSISAEFYTYAIFAVVMLYSRHSTLALILGSIFLILATGAILSQTGMETTKIAGPARCVYAFFMGVITFNIINHFKLQEKFQSSWPAVVLLAASVVLVVVLGDETRNPALLIVPLVFSLTILALVATGETANVNRVLANRFLVYLGTISYGLYMIHYGLWWMFKQVARFVFKVPTSVGDDGAVGVVFDSLIVGDLVVILGLAVLVFLAHLSYKYIESKFTMQRFGIKASSPKPA